jgi:GntR family transcriptional regulator
MVVRESPIPLYVQIDEELRRAIRDGTLAPMALVASEADLAERYNVSRMTARKALDRLVGDGLIFRQPGKGTFVAPPKISHGPNQALSFSAAMRAQGIEFETRVLDSGLIPAPPDVAAALGAPPDARVVLIRRLRRVLGEPSALHVSYLPARYAAVLDRDLTGSLSELMASVGAKVESSRDSIEAVVRADDARVLGVPPGSPLVLIRGVAFSLGVDPVRYTEAVYRADRWRFLLDTSRPATDFRPEPK